MRNRDFRSEHGHGAAIQKEQVEWAELQEWAGPRNMEWAWIRQVEWADLADRGSGASPAASHLARVCIRGPARASSAPASTAADWVVTVMIRCSC